MTVANELGEFLAAARPSTLPSEARTHAAMVVASTIASAAAGRRIPSARIIRELARERGGEEQASIWFAGGPRLPVDLAAQANAVASDAAASDDTDLRNIVHAGSPATAAAIALAERIGGSGEAVLAAITLGYEAAGRISSAITPGFRQRGFHGSIGAIFAAAVASGRLLSFNGEEMAHAIALAATSIGGLTVAANTSTAREYHAGLATLLGIEATLATAYGFQPEVGILECRGGFFESFGGGDGLAAGESATRDLGESWDIVTDMAIKLVPGSHAFHSIAEAAANAAREGGFSSAEIARITISRPDMVTVVGPRHPSDLISMAHSSAYFAAAGVADRSFSWIHASEEKIMDPEIHRLIDLVEVGTAPQGEVAEHYRQGATVTIRARDGREAASTVYLPRGAGPRGISWEDVDEKYRALTPGALPEKAVGESLALVHRLEELASVIPLTELLRTGGP